MKIWNLTVSPDGRTLDIDVYGYIGEDWFCDESTDKEIADLFVIGVAAAFVAFGRSRAGARWRIDQRTSHEFDHLLEIFLKFEFSVFADGFCFFLLINFLTNIFANFAYRNTCLFKFLVQYLNQFLTTFRC